MARDTIRDQIWNYALVVTQRKGESVTVEQTVKKTGASRHTTRDTLNTIAAKGFIRRDVHEDGSVRYLPVD